MRFYITGDTHKKFDRVEGFCLEHHTTTDDVMVILGDSGINYWLSPKDEKLKERVARIPVTFTRKLIFSPQHLQHPVDPLLFRRIQPLP